MRVRADARGAPRHPNAPDIAPIENDPSPPAMDYRQGVCTGCQNSFRVPATFVQNKAKCPKCGGVVEIGPVQSASAPAAAAPAPTPAAPATPPAASVPAKVPPTRPSTPAPAPRPAAAAPAPKPAAPAKPVAKPAAAAPKAAAPKAAAPAAKPAAKPSVRASAEAAAAKVKSDGKSKSDARSKQDDAGEGKRRRSGSHHGPKKSAAPLLVSALALLVLGGGAGWYFLVKIPQDEAAAAEAKAQAEEARRAALLGQGSSVAAAEKPTDDPAESSTPTGGQGAEEQTEPTATAAKPEPAASSAPVDDIDLMELPVLEKYSKTTDEEWKEIVDLAKTFVDINAGARSGRAGRQLEEIGRGAFPALLNEFRVLDLATEDGFRRGDMIQKTLERICNGQNYGWSYWNDSDDPETQLKAVIYDKKAIKAWFRAWEKAGEDDAQWAGLTKQNKPAEDEAKKPAGGSGSPLDDF